MIEENLDNEDLGLNLQKLQAMSFDEFYQFCQRIMKDSAICSAYLDPNREG